MSSAILQQLSRPFHPTHVSWKPGAVAKSGNKAMALAYGDLRAYMNRLDEVCGLNWAVTYSPWGDKIICHLTIDGVTRSSTGEPDKQSERSEIDGTAAEAQAFKRACAMFGLGRYLYSLPNIWAEFDPERKQFTDGAKAKLVGMLHTHYKRWEQDRQPDITTEDAAAINGSVSGDGKGPTLDLTAFQDAAKELYGDKYAGEMERLAGHITKGQTNDVTRLTQAQADLLAGGLRKKIDEARAHAESLASYAEAELGARPQWSGAAQAQEWAVQTGAFATLKEAQTAWREMARASFPKGLTKETMGEALDTWFQQYAAETA